MSGVLHPVGPDGAQTYWVRRVAVIVAAVIVLAVVIALIVNGTSTGSAQSNPSPVIAVPSPTDTPTPSAAATGMRTPLASTPASTASATPTSSASATPTAAKPPAVKPTASATPTTSVTPAKGPVACDPKELRPTLTGKQSLKVKKPNKFALSLINGSGATCIIALNSKTFELKIYSGTDRIWSTNDCSTAIKPVSRKIADEQALEWNLTWNGLRSRSGCKNRPEIPRAGTYFATAQFQGAKPVQLRMVLHG